jgi:ABC-type branched-subunit amino acid transport system ATPase component
MLKVENLIAGYIKDSPVLKGLGFTLAQGETLAVIGQNGTGKSTLAKAILNMLPFRSGNIQFEGTEITNYSTQQTALHGIGYFMQGGQVFPHLTVWENLTFAARNASDKQFKTRFDELCQYFHFLADKKRLAGEASYLSGGEKNQLSLAMVLMNRPKMLILDEPGAGLSPHNTDLMYNTLTDIHKHEPISILLIEQNVNKAIQFSNQTILLANGNIAKTMNNQSENVLQTINKFYFKTEKL